MLSGGVSQVSFYLYEWEKRNGFKGENCIRKRWLRRMLFRWCTWLLSFDWFAVSKWEFLWQRFHPCRVQIVGVGQELHHLWFKLHVIVIWKKCEVAETNLFIDADPRSHNKFNEKMSRVEAIRSLFKKVRTALVSLLCTACSYSLHPAPLYKLYKTHYDDFKKLYYTVF